MKVAWMIKNKAEAMRSHASDYRTPFDAFYEYIKNLEEAQADNIFFEILHDKKTVLIYGNSQGLTASSLDQLRLSIGESEKGATHHGLGILAYLRFCKKMTMVSRKDGKLYILSCDENLDSDTGYESDGVAYGAREVSFKEDCELECYYRKLRNFGDHDGTITILEGIGQYKSPRFDFSYNMKEVFDTREFVKWVQEKLFFNLHYHDYFLKVEGGSATAGKHFLKKEKIPAKIGTGKKYEFTIPSAKYPVEAIPGQRHDCFEYGGRQFKLKIRFMFFVGPSNDGNIQISEECQNGLMVKDAIKIKLRGDSVFKNTDYASFLNGLIDFKIIPVDGKDRINVYSGTRSTLLIDNSFGDCLCNILNYADEEVIRPAIAKVEKRSDSFKDDLRSQNLQKDMEMLFRDMRGLAEDLMIPKHTGPVFGSNMVHCPKCKMNVIPKRGVKSTDIKVYERNVIYGFEDMPKYRCGNCGTIWDRRVYESEPRPKPEVPPIYETPEKGEGVPRQRLRGYGLSFKVCPFDRGDTRRSMVFGNVVKINTMHQDYQVIEKDKRHKDTLSIYERVMAMEAVANHFNGEIHRDDYAGKVQNAIAGSMVWFTSLRQRMSSEEIDRLHEQDATKVGQDKSVAKLAERWGAKVG